MERRSVAVAVVLMLLAGDAAAQELDAEQLFRLGKKLMKEQKYEGACAAFEASQKAEPNTTTLAQLANCREKNGQLATAWGTYLQLVADTKGDKEQQKLNAAMRSKADAIEGRLSSVSIRLSDAAQKILGLQIVRDGTVVDPALWATELPVDGGTHAIVARAPGFQEWTGSVEVAAEGDHQIVEIPGLVFVPPEERPAEVSPSGLPPPSIPVIAEEAPFDWRPFHRKPHVGAALSGMYLGDEELLAAGRVTVALRMMGIVEPRVSAMFFYRKDEGECYLLAAEAFALVGAHSTFGIGIVAGAAPYGPRPMEFDNRDVGPAIGLALTPFSYRFGEKNGSELGGVLYLIAGTDETVAFPMLSFTQFFR